MARCVCCGSQVAEGSTCPVDGTVAAGQFKAVEEKAPVSRGLKALIKNLVSAEEPAEDEPEMGEVEVTVKPKKAKK